MVCKQKTKLTEQIENHKSDHLENTGREQFFWHYPYSELPIRDIRNKTEPHIEIGAENYLRGCYQPSVGSFCLSEERYLFLCTTCKNRTVGNGDFFGRRFMIGYIEKKGYSRIDRDRLVAIGETYLVPFDEKLSYDKLGLGRSRGMQTFGIEETKRLLDLIHQHKNILDACFQEMIRKEDEARSLVDLPIDEECLGKSCTYRDMCLRNGSK